MYRRLHVFLYVFLFIRSLLQRCPTKLGLCFQKSPSSIGIPRIVAAPYITLVWLGGGHICHSRGRRGIRYIDGRLMSQKRPENIGSQLIVAILYICVAVGRVRGQVEWRQSGALKLGRSIFVQVSFAQATLEDV